MAIFPILVFGASFHDLSFATVRRSVPEEKDLEGSPRSADAAVELGAVLRVTGEPLAPADGRGQRAREPRQRAPRPQQEWQ